MDEQEDKDVSGSAVLESSKEAASDRVASGDSEKTRVVEPAASDVQVQGQDVTKGSSTEEVVAEKGGSCNGADLNVGVMASNIHVDGVCVRDADGGGGGKLSEEGTSSLAKSGEMGSESNAKDLVGGVDTAGDPGSKADMESGVEASNLRTESEVGKSCGVAESKEEKLGDGHATITKVIDVTRGDIGVGDAQNMAVDSAVEVSSGEEIQAVVDNVAVATGEKCLEGRSGNEFVEKVGINVTADMHSQDIRVLESGTQDERVENGVGGSSAGVGYLVGETQVFTSEKSEPAEETIDRAKETNGGGEYALQDSETVNVSVSHDEVLNPEIEATVAPSSTVVEDSNLGIQVAEGEAMVTGNNENLNLKSEAALEEKHGIDFVEGDKSSPEKDSDSAEKDAVANKVSRTLGRDTQVAEEEDMVRGNNENLSSKSEAPLEEKHGSDVVDGGISSSEKDSDSMKKEAVANIISKTLDGYGQVAEEEAVVMGNDENSNSKSEAAVEEKHSSDVEGGISSSVKDSDSTIKDANANAVSKTLDGHAQVAQEEAMVMGNNENLNSKSEAALEEKHSRDVVEGRISSSEKDAITDTISKSLDGHTQVAVDGKVASMDSADITYPNVEGMDTDAFNENFCFSVEELQATVETANGRTENHYDAFADSQSSQQHLVVGGDVVATENKMLLNSNKHEKLVTGEFPDQTMSHESSQVNSNVDPEMGVDELVTDTKQAGLQKETDEVETAHKSIENNISLDSTSFQPAQAVVGNEVAEIHVAEKDQELKLEESFDKSAASVPTRVASNIGQLVDGQKQVSHVAQLGGDEKKIVEQDSEAENVSTSVDRVDGRQTVVVNHDMTLNPSAGHYVPEEGDHHLKVEERINENAACEVSEVESDVRKETALDEHVADAENVGLHEGQEMEAEVLDSDSDDPKTTVEKSAKAALNSGSTLKAHQASYQLPPDNEGEFAVSDLVWGKVRSHPWWPGQIFDPSDASEKAIKYHKKDCFLVAYFGDRTFAWNEASLLKPFRSHFSQVEKQSNSETFQNAVNCALEEVSRRVEFGLACSCIPLETSNKVKHQIVQNTGIRLESSMRDGMDKSLHANIFEPAKLVEYMKALAQSPAGGADRLELVIVKSQLLAFYRLKGYSQLPEFQFCGGLLENADTLYFEDELIVNASAAHKDDGRISSGQEILQIQSSYHKRKHNLKDTIYPRKKERSMTELMDESWDSVDDEIGPDGKANSKLVSPSFGKKRRCPDSFADESVVLEGKKTISLAKVSTLVSPPKPSFKIGECIRRVASQMTGSPSILKSNSQKLDGNSDGLVGGGSDVLVQHPEDAEMKRMTVPTEYSSLHELLLQLHLAARDPLKGYSFLTVIVSFFSDFRNAVIVEQHEKVGGKRRQPSIGGFPETFEFEDMNDTYWTDRVIQNGSEEQPSRKSRKRDNQLAFVDPDKPLNRSNSRKRYSDGNHGQLPEKPVAYVDEHAPAELVMHFPVVDSVPSETSLIKMFRRFGPLKESETEIDKDTNRARVVFKKSSDAEAAYGSAPKFNIFGSMLVNYQLNYTITVPFKTEPLVTLPGEEDASIFLQY